MIDFRDNLKPVKDLNGTYATNAYVDVSKCSFFTVYHTVTLSPLRFFVANMVPLSNVCKEKTGMRYPISFKIHEKISFSSSERQVN